MEVVGEAGNADESVEVMGRNRRSRIVVLVGLGLTGSCDAFALIRLLRERSPEHAVLALGANADAITVSRALFVGADGFVDKNLDPLEFLQALRRAAEGELVMAIPETVTVSDVAIGLDRRRRFDARLTHREREVLTVAAEGLTAREIADRLGVRERTVTTHLARIYAKLGVGNRLSAIRLASSSGLVAVGRPR